jgi:hypothetical protein
MLRKVAIALALCLLAAPALAQVPAPASPVGGGVLNIGQAFGPFLQPYVDATVQGLIAALGGWVVWILKTKLGINVDAQHRDAIISAVQRQASSLVADGFVKIDQSGKIQIDNPSLYYSAQAAMAAVPDAVKHFGLTPQALADRIVDALPHVPSVAGAQATVIAKNAG